ncbi:MAG: SMP-30/gluconolactonase/LRE family protein [Alphaproteobacteria bacterium]|nr:SMP-30/gluconolactonase/LRE family protein [Alphaproteobacteria bacterium]
MRTQILSIHDVANGVGESPVWDAGILRWVDITGRAVHALRPDGTIDSQAMPDFPCFLALRRGGGAIVGLRNRLCHLDLSTGATTTFHMVEPDRSDNRCNEGGVDPAGRLWFGTMQDNLTPTAEPKPIAAATGALYRFDPGGVCTRMLDGVGLSNTLAWSPDGGLMYFGDTLENRIRTYRLDPDGGIVDSADFHVAGLAGACDGSTLDAEGYLWNARFGAGCLIRFAPDGSVDARIDLPVTNPTSCCFGGSDLRTLYVTSARFGLSDAALAANPQEGALVVLSTDIQGLPANRFAG